ncbi:hypothetical protein [Acidovorax sp. SUPP3334]|uniref:hypothetical protein n=1 Tax=Acidovorax sp. SUPP3334 TaxID=2920881 RepID=UPI0023DE6912|nr:hypothetical protein [Acidovorax sp. SUPP3334]GKT22160.1 hypothetical protein AVHM3334_07390 [Acidovorax sp. SUPP3334]
MSLLSKLSNRLGIARFNVETPTGQKQKTPSIPSSAVRPLDGPARRRTSAASTLPPRATVPSAPTPSASSGPSAAGAAVNAETTARPGPTHVLIDAMAQAAPNGSLLTKALFEPTPKIFGVAADLAFALGQVDFSRMPPVPGLPGAPAVLLAQALAAATGGDARLARDALESLQALDPQVDIVTAWRQRAGGPEDDAASVYATPQGSEYGDDALRSDDSAEGGSVYHTPDSSVNGDQVRSLPASPRRSGAGGPGDASAAARRAAWQVAAALAGTPTGLDVLQAVVARPVDAAHSQDFALLLKAATGMPARHAERGDPAAILASAQALGTLTGQAVACAAARMAGEAEAARPHQWALTAVRNDLFDTGPGTDFAAVDARLMKTGRWIERATPERSRLLRNPIFGKSPFRALRHGTQNVERGPAIARHRLARETALREAAVALKDQLIAAAPSTRSPRPGQVPQGLLRAAVLAHCLQAPAPQPLERDGFDDDARADIADRLANLLTPAPAPGLQRQLAQMPQLTALADLRLDAKAMGEWFSAARTAGGSETAQGTREAPGAPEAQALPWVQAVSTALARAEEEAEGRDTRVPVVTRETVRSALKDIIGNIEGSSRLRLSSGGLVGVGLRQITSSISAVASAFFLRGRVDGRAQRGRQAVFEIAMPPYDMELVLGSQRQVSKQIGVGAFVGPDIGVAKAGVNVDTLLYGKDKADIQGISLRLPRVGRPVPELRAEFSALVDAMLDGSEGGAQAGDATPLLQRLLQDFPELTVNRIGTAGDGRRRHGAGADLMAAVGQWGAKVSAGAGGFVEAQRNVTKHYADATGHMRVERSIQGHALRAGAGVKASAGPFTSAASGTSFSGGVDVSLATAQFGVSAEHILSGVFDRREAVYEAGRLHPLSFVETEYQKVDAFMQAVQPHMEEWVDAGADPGRLEGLLADIREHAAPTHSFAARYIVTPEARAQNDAYRSSMQLCGQHPSGLPQAVAALAGTIEAKWEDPASVQPYSLRSYERNSVQQTQGVDVVVQLASVEAAEASHIDNRLDVPAQRPRRAQ